MADSTVAALTAASALDGTELLYGVQGGADRKVTGAQIKTLVSASPTLVTPALGTPASGVMTNVTGLPLTTGVTGTLPVANGGTGTTSPSIVAGTNVTVTGTWPNQTIAAASGGGSFSGGSVTSPIVLPVGSNTAPSLVWSGATNTGLYANYVGDMRYSNGGVDSVDFTSAGIGFHVNCGIAWNSAALNSASDTGIARISAGLLEVNNGSMRGGNYRDIKARNVITDAVTVATLIAAATAGAGARSFVTDATVTLTAGVGTIVAGSGSNAVPCYSDGTNWRIG